MKKLMIIGLAFLAFSCQQKENKDVSLNATIDGAEDGTKVYLASLGENGQPVPEDTVEVKEGKFEMPLPEVDFQSLNVITLESGRSNMIFINENKSLTAKVYKDSLRSSEIEGGEHNKIFDTYVNHLMENNKKIGEMRKKYQDPKMMNDPEVRKEIQEVQDKLTQEDAKVRKQLIEDNPNSIVSILVLSDMVNMKMIPSNEMKELFESLDSEVQKSIPGKSVSEALEKASITAIGSKAPSFSAPTPDGGELSLEEAMGKITIIDFWASWCKPCRIENPNLVKLYNKYHDKGLNIIGVSLDKQGQKEKWLKAIEDDNLPWQQVSNLQFWQGPIAQTYGIKSIPAAFILDENGVIIEKDLRGDALEAKVAELLE